MNREIKFRAWHIGEEKMCNVNLLRPDNGAFLEGLIPEPDQHVGDKFIVPALESGKFCDMAEFHLMQFTGLLDKSGKEIYEGDIVTFTRSTGNYQTGSSRLITDTCKIVFDMECHRFALSYNASIQKLRRHPNYHYEIIGNIYEPLQTRATDEGENILTNQTPT